MAETSSTTKPIAPTFSFFDLPRELRDEILKHYITDHRRQHTMGYSKGNPLHGAIRYRASDMDYFRRFMLSFFVNRQFHREATSILGTHFFPHITFEFGNGLDSIRKLSHFLLEDQNIEGVVHVGGASRREDLFTLLSQTSTELGFESEDFLRSTIQVHNIQEWASGDGGFVLQGPEGQRMSIRLFRTRFRSLPVDYLLLKGNLSLLKCLWGCRSTSPTTSGRERMLIYDAPKAISPRMKQEWPYRVSKGGGTNIDGPDIIL
jgi:hypothetical protein